MKNYIALGLKWLMQAAIAIGCACFIANRFELAAWFWFVGFSFMFAKSVYNNNLEYGVVFAILMGSSLFYIV